MKTNSIVFSPGLKAVRLLESFTDKICESLFINDTYYGNILMCLTDLNEILLHEDIEVKLFYETDFSVLSIVAEKIDSSTNKRQETNKVFKNNELEYQLIETLSDKFIIKTDTIEMEFNIGALHNSVYEERLRYLKDYFNKFIDVRKLV